MIPATAPWDDSSLLKSFTLPKGGFKWMVYGIYHTNYEQPTTGEIAASEQLWLWDSIRCDDRLPWDDSSLLKSLKLLYFLGEYLGVPFFRWWASQVLWTVPLKYKKQAPNALSLLLNGSTSSWMISGSLFIIVMLYNYLYYTHLKLTAKVPEKMGETGIITIFSFPFAVWA